ncbi:MAG: hypothetical protein IT385_00665 [Deltaproteobacteria bacterium]|nr:hypothetical protein [Deltaproteobacteria bacterium]
MAFFLRRNMEWPVKMRTTILIKKYGNRRMYDSIRSRYVTIDEVAQMIRDGEDVEIVDAASNVDITHATLMQILIESGGAQRVLSVPLLHQIIRGHDTAVPALMGEWLNQALDAYHTGQSVADAMTPLVPAAATPYTMTNALARMMTAGMGLMSPFGPPYAPAPAPPAAPPPPPAHQDDIAELRRELEALRKDLARDRARPPDDRPARPRKRRTT